MQEEKGEGEEEGEGEYKYEEELKEEQCFGATLRVHPVHLMKVEQCQAPNVKPRLTLLT